MLDRERCGPVLAFVLKGPFSATPSGGAITFNAAGQNENLPSACVQIRDGRPTVVLPEASAEKKPVYPVPGWTQRG